MTFDMAKFNQMHRDLLTYYHEECIAEAQQSADEAAARGSEWFHRFHQERADDLRATPLPWDINPALWEVRSETDEPGSAGDTGQEAA
jgi:hypothetical protein